MLKYLIPFFILFSFLSFKIESENDLKCIDFHKGKFYLINKDTNRKYFISRKIDFQSEKTFNLKTGKKFSGIKNYKIKWKNDCEYTLIIDTSKKNIDETDLYINSNGGLNCKIVKIEGNCASVITSFENSTIESKICKYE
ncbi:hypothetical protein SAMN05421876_101139 [Kaistella jeonii]|nr:hypothetical protein SAMN05421876_101139 [Kaistella jeonii]VEI94739.1 Uncharacterised protein [Kaistella jeonii]